MCHHSLACIGQEAEENPAGDLYSLRGRLAHSSFGDLCLHVGCRKLLLQRAISKARKYLQLLGQDTRIEDIEELDLVEYVRQVIWH